MAGMLSMQGKKVLHMDGNTSHFGGESASLTPLKSVFAAFGHRPPERDYDDGEEWKIDLISKFLLAEGHLLKLLVLTDVTENLRYKSLECHYYFKGSKMSKLPADMQEYNKSDLMTVVQKWRFWNFLKFIINFSESNPQTWKVISDFDPRTNTIQTVYSYFKIDVDSIDLIGHAMCLYIDDEYLTYPATEVIKRLQLYCNSIVRYGKSPYIYPLHGIGELSKGFSLFSQKHGAVAKYDKAVDEIVLKEGKMKGVRIGQKFVQCEQLYCDPSYVPKLVTKVGEIVRAICLMDHPLANTKQSLSTHIIIPKKKLNRNSDIYVSMVSYTHRVAPKGWFVATVCTRVETHDPEAELAPGIDLLQPVKQMFVKVSPYYVPIDDGTENQIFVSESYDATSNFETTYSDVMSLLHRGTGEIFDLSPM